MVVGLGHQFVGLIGGRIEAHRVVERVLLSKRHLAVAAVDRAVRGIHEVVHTLVPAALEHVAKAIEVGLDLGRGVLD